MTRALAGIGLATLCAAGLIILGIFALYLSLPNVNDLRGCVTTTLYRVHLCEKDASYVQLSQISPYVMGAIIMSEDASFYFHAGVDIDEMKESFKKDINEGRFARGASTITQQLVKNVFLTNSKSLLRKAEEIYLALQIEKIFSKARILALYLNVVEFGPNIYGIKAASQYYFNRSPSEISPEQAAFLAFLLPNPKKYHQSFKDRRLTEFANKTVRTILHKMNKGHKITDEEYQAAMLRMPEFPWNGAASIKAAVDQPPTQENVDASDEANQEDNNFKFDFNTDEDEPKIEESR